MALTAGADVFFSTDFSSATQPGGTGTAITMGGTVADGVTVSTLTAGSGAQPLRLDAGDDVHANESIGINESTTLAQAVSKSEYFEFTIRSADAMSYDSFSFNLVKVGTSKFAGITLRSSLDSYASDLLTVANDSAAGEYPGSVDLSSMTAFDNQTNVTFRFYLYDEYSGTANRRLGIDDISINATIPGAHMLTVNGGNGSGLYTAGQQVAIIASNVTGTVFDEWIGDTQVLVGAAFVASNTVIMPTNDVTLTATYKPVYLLTVNGGTGGGWYTNGQQVAITANVMPTPFLAWTGDTQSVASVSSSNTTVTMSTNPVTLTATHNAFTMIGYQTNSIAEVSGGSIAGKYEPGEIIDITVFSINNGNLDASNVVNSISADPAWFSISNLTASTYSFMPVGAATSTVYRVAISPSATNGMYWFSVINQAGSMAWTNFFSLNVLNQGSPSVSPSSITINVLPDTSATNTEVVVTNSGNAALTFSITDDSTWGTLYGPATGTKGISGFVAAYDVISLSDPAPSSAIIEADRYGVSSSRSIGFGFPFYGTVYSNFYVTADGYIGLSNTTNVPARSADRKPLPATGMDPLIAPFWSKLISPAGSIRMIRSENNYLVISYIDVSKESGTANMEFQTALYTDGRIEFRYKTAGGLTNLYGNTDVTIGLQGSTTAYTNLTLAPINGSSVMFDQQQDRWVNYSPSQDVTVEPQTSQTISFIANGSGRELGDSVQFDVVFNWSTGGSNVVSVTAGVTDGEPVYSAVSSLSFTGAAGQITSAPFVITNTGNAQLDFIISNSASATAGFVSTNPPYDWIDISSIGTPINLLDPDPNPYITADDEGYSAMIPIRFGFPFYGGSYTQLCVSANGALRFDTVGRIFALHDLASTKSWLPTQMVAPYWGDLAKDANATIKYHAMEDRFVITWENFRQYGLQGGSNLTFQAILTPAGDITFQYKQLEGLQWPHTTIGLRDTPARTRQVDILQTNDWSVTTLPYSGAVYTQYVSDVSDRAVQFHPAQIQTIRYKPGTGSIPAGETAEITIVGDASGLSAGGANSVVTNAVLSIAHNAAGNPATLAVTFTATNSQETVFARAAALTDDSDGDGILDDQERIAGTDPQDAGSVFTVSTTSGRELFWPSASGRIYTVWYTLDLKDNFVPLEGASGLSTNEFIDTIHTNAPVIFYKVTVD